jgi:dihydrofolate synthase/folylpolyglutamate synthase
MDKAYRQAVDRLYQLQKFGIKLGLNSTANLLERLGDPHLRVPCVHLAGTNGKGSVGAMLEAACLAAGIKVGLYTSPHLISFNERFRVAGRDVDDQTVLDLCDAVWKVTDPREPPTFFEFVTAMAFELFAREQVDLTLLETGLGGRLDATNVCLPLVTVITNVGLEHQEYLGRRLKDIAWEKAGIIKRGVPLVHGVDPGPAREVVEARAAELGAPLIRRGRDLRHRWRRDGAVNLYGCRWQLAGVRLNLVGRHQASNASLVLGVAEELARRGISLNPDALRSGLGSAHWPGRLECWSSQEGQPSIWLDGAHNLHAARALLHSLDLVKDDRAPLIMVLGIMADKDIPPMLELLTPVADRVIYTRPVYDRAAEPRRLARLAPADAAPGEVEEDLGAAIDRARELAGPGGVVLITGSLFTVGEARARLQGLKKIYI